MFQVTPRSQSLAGHILKTWFSNMETKFDLTELQQVSGSVVVVWCWVLKWIVVPEEGSFWMYDTMDSPKRLTICFLSSRTYRIYQFLHRIHKHLSCFNYAFNISSTFLKTLGALFTHFRALPYSEWYALPCSWWCLFATVSKIGILNWC